MTTLILALCLSLAGAASAFDGLSGRSMRLLLASQDAYNNLDFAKARPLAEGVAARHPHHPLPLIFIQGGLLAEIQERVAAGESDAGLYARFESVTASALDAALAREARRKDALSQVYLGSCLGARGLVKMYRGELLSAFGDGQAAASAP